MKRNRIKKTIFKTNFKKLIFKIILFITNIYLLQKDNMINIYSNYSYCKYNKISNILKNDTISNSIKNNKDFLCIKTIHKSKYSFYNYTDNIVVYKDLYSDIKYVTINENNTIIYSPEISKEKYFELCEKKILLDKRKYKRNQRPKISVIIPYFNQNKFLLNIPLRSIQNQSFKDIEIIFVDDGSSEEKINEIIEEMKIDNRIILLRHKKNKGILISRVDGVRYSSGEYIIQLDQDDLYINNLLLENLYKKSKELNIEIVQFSSLFYRNKTFFSKEEISIKKNEIITQPELRITFLKRLNEKRLGNCLTRLIWDKFVRKETYLKAIEDLGDEYINHIFFLYEDTLMMFELSQIAFSYYFYDIEGYRYNFHLNAQSRNKIPMSKRLEILSMNQLYFVKLLLYKVDPKFDRYHIFKEFGLNGCGSDVKWLNRKNDIDLLYEVLEVIFKLERLFKNTAPELLACATHVKRYFGIIK